MTPSDRRLSALCCCSETYQWDAVGFSPSHRQTFPTTHFSRFLGEKSHVFKSTIVSAVSPELVLELSQRVVDRLSISFSENPHTGEKLSPSRPWVATVPRPSTALAAGRTTTAHMETLTIMGDTATMQIRPDHQKVGTRTTIGRFPGGRELHQMTHTGEEHPKNESSLPLCRRTHFGGVRGDFVGRHRHRPFGWKGGP